MAQVWIIVWVECTIRRKVLAISIGALFGLVGTLVFMRLSYTKPNAQKPSKLDMDTYISKQIQTANSYSSVEFDPKVSQQLEQFMSDAITVTDTAKISHAHSELQQFATDSTYKWGYNREGARLIQEDLGLKPKHEGPHCDSVGSC